MKKFLCLVYFFAFAAYHASAHNVDSLTKALATKMHDTTRVLVMNMLGVDGNPDSSEYLLKQALALAKRNKYVRGQIIVNNNLGNLYSARGEYPLALEYLLEDYKLLSESGRYKQALATVANNIGIIYMELGDLKRTKQYYDESLKHADSMENLSIYGNLASYYLLSKQYDSAEYFANFVGRLTTDKEVADWQRISRGYAMLTTVEIYLKTGRQQKAVSICKETLSTLKGLEDTEVWASANKNMGAVYDSLSMRDSALYYYRQAIRLTSRYNYVVQKMQTATLFSKFWEKSGKVDSAYHYLKLFEALKDSTSGVRMKAEFESITLAEQRRLEEAQEQEQLDRKDKKELIQLFGIAALIPAFFLFVLKSNKRKISAKALDYIITFGLLFTFEFIALLIHYFVGKITHHNLLVILITMIVAASMLLPVHHRLEKWFKEKYNI
ncbi:MAG: hypothetical protein RL660_2441 [Bacteroidota bacterium]|jgi:tetratricopeptide (TPR) repeat protein